MDIEVELVGGLGNQLFGYYAGLYYSIKNSGHLTLNYNNIHTYFEKESNIRAFKLSDHQTRLDPKHNASYRMLSRKIRDKILLDFPQAEKIIYPRTFLVGDEIEFQQELNSHKKKILLRGYFGDFSYFKYCKKYFENPTLISPSESFKYLSEEARSLKPIMLHIRRGDYVDHAGTYGLLSERYYSQAITLAKKLTGSDLVWVFSDETERARKTLSKIDGKFRFVEDESILSPPESLVLQSQGGANITANSTFSAWAAALNSDNVPKICPSQYFVDNRKTPHWPPEGWTGIEPHWE